MPAPATDVRRGTPAVPGVAAGPVVRPGERPDPTAAPATSERGADAERVRYDAAVAAVVARLEARREAASGVAAEVLGAQVALVADRGLTKAVVKRLEAGASAEGAAWGAVEEFGALLERLGGMMAERVTDLRDLGQRVVGELMGLPEPGIPAPAEPSVLMADDLAPADTAGLDPTRIVALVTRLGGPTSHTAIIARQLGIPCVVAADVGDIAPGTDVLVDGARGEVLVNPGADERERRIAADRAVRAAAAAYSGPGRTRDGVAVAVYANVQDGPTARAAASGVAEGVGLFRSELAFLGRADEPSVDEQADLYAEVLLAFAGRRVVIRTLDAGSDKPMAFASLPDEPNPALGVRGLRLSWERPGLLTRQLDAIAHAAARTGHAPWVMAPMVATAAEAAAFAAHVRERDLVPGVMIEVPAAAVLAERILAEVEFASIGTNDLVQYTMAADRLASPLATLTDFWQPAVLHLMAAAAAGGRAAGRPVGVCGEAAADPLMACVLAGLGVTSLSMADSACAAVGARLAGVDHASCAAAADAALGAADPAAARAAAEAALAG